MQENRERMCDRSDPHCRKEGYVDLNKKDTLQAGDKVYMDWMGKSIVLFQIGEDSLEKE